jgi:hypothetical protein
MRALLLAPLWAAGAARWALAPAVRRAVLAPTAAARALLCPARGTPRAPLQSFALLALPAARSSPPARTHWWRRRRPRATPRRASARRCCTRHCR